MKNRRGRGVGQERDLQVDESENTGAEKKHLMSRNEKQGKGVLSQLPESSSKKEKKKEKENKNGLSTSSPIPCLKKKKRKMDFLGSCRARKEEYHPTRFVESWKRENHLYLEKEVNVGASIK